jgi:hypothetical protein
LAHRPIVADIRLRHLLIGMGMPALAALIAAFGLLMLELAGYFALVRMAPLPKHRSLRPIPRYSPSRPRLGREFRVCFLLGITSINPDRNDLLFERFVSEERRQPLSVEPAMCCASPVESHFVMPL